MAEPDDPRRPETRPSWPALAPGAGMTRRRALALVLGGAAGAVAALAGCSSDEPSESGEGASATAAQGTTQGKNVVMYSSPSCGCCSEYADYLGSEGYAVDLRRTSDLDTVKTDAGVPEEAASCHTMLLGDYVVEGHVPVETIDKLLHDRPAIDGIALPGMPLGSPGMSGTKAAPFEILSFSAGQVQPYATV